MNTYLRGIVSQDPGKHWILHVVVVGPPGQGVEVHEILEIAHVPFLQKSQRGDKPNTAGLLLRPMWV